MEHKKTQVVITMVYDITYFPPAISLCNILRKLDYDVIFIGDCSSLGVKEKLEKIGVKLYIYKYGGNGIARFYQQYCFKKNVHRIMKIESKVKKTILWVLHSETISLLSSIIDKYNTIAHLLEFRPKMKLAYCFLSSFHSFKKSLHKTKSVVCCEYNRGQLTKALFNLSRDPYILPNKAYFEGLEDDLTLSDDIISKMRKYKNKKIILYQGIFISERKLDDYIVSVNALSDEYILLLMGNPNNIYFELKAKYESEKIVFLPFLPPPLHMQITKMAYIGILSYIPNNHNFAQAINVLYCAPNKIFEYSKYGKPMISNDLPAIRFAFMENKAGICLSDLTTKDITSAILEIEKDYDKYSNNSLELYNNVDIVDIVNNILSSVD